MKTTITITTSTKHFPRTLSFFASDLFSLLIDLHTWIIHLVPNDLTDQEKKVCETEANMSPPPLPLSQPSSSFCSQPYPNTPQIFTSYNPNVIRRKENDTCFACQQKGHWALHCPFKSSNNRVPFNNDSQCANNMWCRCGHGRCEVKTATNARNRGRLYYACPIKRGVRCKEFVKWCDDPVDDSDLQPPTFKYPECECGAGVCRRVKATWNIHADKYCFTCPFKQGHGSCGYLVWEDELLNNESIGKQSCKRTHSGFGEGDQNDQTDNDLGEGGNLLVKHSKKMRITDSSEDPTLMTVSEADLSQREDALLEKEAPLLSRLSTSSRISGRQNVFERHIFYGADASFGSSPMGWLGRLLFFCPPQSLKFPSPESILCRVFPSFNPIDVPKQPSIPDVPCGEYDRLDVISLSQQTQISSGSYTEFSIDVFSLNKSPERKLMSKAQKRRQLAFVAQKQLLIDLVTLGPHELESMKLAADDTFALLDNLGTNDRQFCEHIWDFISLTSSVAQMNETIENSLSPEEHNKCLEEEKAKFSHIRNLYVKTEAQFQASEQRRQSLCKEISHFEAILFEKQNQLKSYELETVNIEIELGDLRRTMLEADTALKARAEQAKVARKVREERQAKQIATQTALEEAILELKYLLNST